MLTYQTFGVSAAQSYHIRERETVIEDNSEKTVLAQLLRLFWGFYSPDSENE